MRNGMLNDYRVSAKDLINIRYASGDRYGRLIEKYLDQEDEYCKNDVESTEKLLSYFETDDLKRNILDEYVDTDTEIMKYIDQRNAKLKRDYMQHFNQAFKSALKQKHDEGFDINMKIKNVIFSGPCTIVLWADGTKTIVRCDNEDFDKEKGLAMAIAKKAFGNTSKYYNTFKKYIKEEK